MSPVPSPVTATPQKMVSAFRPFLSAHRHSRDPASASVSSTPTTTKSFRPSTARHNLLIQATGSLGRCYAHLAKIKKHTTLPNQGNQDADDEDKSSLLAGRFLCRRCLGRGAFAATMEALDLCHPGRRLVAVKIMEADYAIIGMEEYGKLVRLQHLDPHDACHVVRIITTFTHGPHFCLVFERLNARPWSLDSLCGAMGLQKHPSHHSQETTSLVPSTSLRPAPLTVDPVLKLKQLQKITMQLILALTFLKSNRLIHADIKLENLLLVHEHTCHVKLIDFGNSFWLEQADVYFDEYQVQSFLYRAPEVVMGLPFDYAIDMWSVGVVLCELWTGRSLFEADTREGLVDQMRNLLGPLPLDVFRSAKFFDPDQHTMDVPANRGLGFDLSSDVDLLRFRIRRLSEVLGTRDVYFLRFMNAILELDPAKRLDPASALVHPFLASVFPFDMCLRACVQQQQSLQTRYEDLTSPWPKTEPSLKPIDPSVTEPERTSDTRRKRPRKEAIQSETDSIKSLDTIFSDDDPSLSVISTTFSGHR